MRILSGQTQFDFMGRRRIAVVFSVVLLLASLISLAVRGLEFGIDFTGGTLIEVGYEQAADIDKVRELLSAGDYGDSITQFFGSSQDVLVRVPPRDGTSQDKVGNEVLALLKAGETGAVDLRRVEFVGPQVGEELTEDGGLAMLIALFAIFIYVMLRFEWKFSVGAVAALFHDVIITLGLFSIIGLEFDLTVLAAILAVIGYSLNDTIVVFDRVRENFRTMRKGSSTDIVNTSLNQTLSRTLMTSLTTLLVVLALFFVGGELIHGFATTLIMGIVIGTYSSIYVASSTTLSLGINTQDLMPVEPEGAEEDARP